ncbi:MAG: polysaccharide deacetylase family protein [Pseudomonadota bacterium]
MNGILHQPFARTLARVALACTLAGTGLPAHSADPFRWPQGQRAAVSLAYDDALDSQLDTAIPALRRHRLLASFYLQLSNPAVARRMPEWRAAAAHGHELGNHSLFHQCSGALPDRAWVQPHRNVDTTSIAQMKDQLILANTMLHALDGKTERTFTTPCGDAQAADGDYLAAVKSEFVAIKASSGSGVAESMEGLDPHAVQVHAPVGASGKELIELVKLAGTRGTMVNFTFHGVGGDYLSVSKAAHDELLTFLAANRARYWTAPFVTLMRHVRAEQLKEKSGRRSR